MSTIQALETLSGISDHNSIAQFYDLSWDMAEDLDYTDPALVPKLEQLLPAGASVLDLGAGVGRLSIPLAKAGFNVTAVDVSQVGIDKLESAAVLRGLGVTTHVGNVLDSLESNVFYNGITAMFVLHHLRCPDAVDLVANMQAQTVPGGINALTLFSKSGDMFRSDPSTENFYPSDGRELIDIYHQVGWLTLSYMETTEAAQKNEPEDQILSYLMQRPY